MKKDTGIGGGSIFPRGKKLYIKYKGKQISTGLNNIPENISLCFKKLKDLKLKEFLGIEEKKVITIYQVIKIFEKNHLYNKMEKTVSSYNYCINKIVKHDFVFTIQEIENNVNIFLHNDNISNNSKKIVLRHFNTLLNFAYNNNLLEKKLNLLTKFKVKTTKKIVRTFSDDEINKILIYFKEKDNEFALMCELMIYSGLRIGETLDLTWSQIDFNKKDILLKNKISKDDEIIPLSDRIIEIFNNIERNTEKVFRWSKNSKSSLNRKFDRCMKDLEINKNNRSFHNFRKTFRMKLFKANIPLENAKELLRHKDIRTTIENYTEYARQELINDMNKI